MMGNPPPLTQQAGPALHAQHLAVQIKGNRLLAPLDLNLTGGQWHGIAGPNGGGKSTLLKAIAGLLNHQGRIEFHWPNESNHAVGYLPQLAPFDATLPVTTLDFLRMHRTKPPIWRRYQGDAAIERVIAQVGIEALLKKRIGTLSTGERQRVLLACALLDEPSLLLLDEPFAGVDRSGREQMLTILQSFQRQGGTLIMVEHDWSVIQQHCYSVSWIDAGLVAHGTPADVFEQASAMTMGFRHAS